MKKVDRAPFPLVKAKRILKEFEDAVRDDAFRGTMHPDDRDSIYERYLVLKERMLLRLTKDTGGQ